MRKPPDIEIPGAVTSKGAVIGTIALVLVSWLTGGIGIAAMLTGFTVMVLADAWFGTKVVRSRKIDAERVTRFTHEERDR